MLNKTKQSVMKIIIMGAKAFLRTFSSSLSLPESFAVDPPRLCGFYLKTEENEEK